MKNYLLPVLFAFLFQVTLFSQVNYDSCLVAWYPFNSNAMDESGNGNHGIVLGPTLTADRFGLEDRAYYFDGVDDYIAVNPLSDVKNVGDFTLLLWFLLENWESQPGIVNGVIDQQYIFDGHSHSATVMSDYYRDGFHINLKLKEEYLPYLTETITEVESGTSSVKEMPFDNSLQNRWTNAVFIRKGDSTYHLLNADTIGAFKNTNIPLNMDHTWFIGTFTGNNPHYNSFNYNFQGKIDDIRIYDCALPMPILDSLYIQSIQSSGEISKQTTLKVFPNPTHGLLRIDNLGNSVKSIDILNGSGQLILTFAQGTDLIDMSYLSPGFYLLRISYMENRGPAFARIIKM